MELFSLQTLLFVFLLSLYLYLHFYHAQKKPINKGFEIYPLVGTLPEFLKYRHRFLDWSTEVLSRCPTNTSIFRRPFMFDGFVTANPLNVEHMLKTNFENYPKGDRFISLLEDFLGRGIFNSDGELWKVQRKTVLQRASETKRVMDFQDILERFAFDNVCKLAFNVDPGCLGDDGIVSGEFMRAFEDATTLGYGRFVYALPFLYRSI